MKTDLLKSGGGKALPRPLSLRIFLIALFGLFLAAPSASAQTLSGTTPPSAPAAAPGSITRDAKGHVTAYAASNGRTYKMGDTIQLGAAKRIDNMYMNIRTAGAKRHVWDNSDHMEGKYAGMRFTIEGMYAGGGILEGKSAPQIVYFYFKVKGFFGGLYEITVEPALMQQEFQ